MVGSQGGAPTDPAWVANLRAHPDEVSVQDGPEPWDGVAREITGDEKAVVGAGGRRLPAVCGLPGEDRPRDPRLPGGTPRLSSARTSNLRLPSRVFRASGAACGHLARGGGRMLMAPSARRTGPVDQPTADVGRRPARPVRVAAGVARAPRRAPGRRPGGGRGRGAGRVPRPPAPLARRRPAGRRRLPEDVGGQRRPLRAPAPRRRATAPAGGRARRGARGGPGAAARGGAPAGRRGAADPAPAAARGPRPPVLVGAERGGDRRHARDRPRNGEVECVPRPVGAGEAAGRPS